MSSALPSTHQTLLKFMKFYVVLTETKMQFFRHGVDTVTIVNYLSQA